MVSVDNEKDFYRASVGIALINSKGQLWIGRRCYSDKYWQMPQGGIGKKETVEQAFYREIKEELGLKPQMLEIITTHEEWLQYEFPDNLIRKSSNKNKGRCIGQNQMWVLCVLKADDSCIDINHSECAEFVNWCWQDPNLVPELVITFKRKIYKKLIGDFLPLIKEYTKNNGEA